MGEPPVVKIKRKVSDFRFGPVLGEGSFSTVSLATEIKTGNEYAIKVLEKRHMIKEKKAHQVEREKRILSRLFDHPFFIKMYFTFQDSERLFFALSVARRGELHSKIRQLGKFDMECTRFYSAQIVAGLEFMHSLHILHRDLKPENILFNDDMNIQITDFGTAKDLEASAKEEDEEESNIDVWLPRTSTFVGTAQFISPEVLADKKACAASDLWALGCILFQMITGKFAFHAATEYLVLTKVQSCQYELPEEFSNEPVADLIKQILVLDPTQRLGCPATGGYEKLKQHPFFEAVDWENIYTTPVPETIKEVLVSDSSDDESTYPSYSEHEILLGFNDLVIPESAQQIPIERVTMHHPTLNNGSENLCQSEPKDVSGYGLPPSLPSYEHEKWMQKQKNSVWDYYAEGKLILKQGQLDKRRGFSNKTREFLLLEGPRLIYIDPNSKQIKGEIPWSAELKTELKTFRNLDVHVPGRTYHLFDKTNNAMKWCKRIDQVKKHYFPPTESPSRSSQKSD